jgi:hypothetical protein
LGEGEPSGFAYRGRWPDYAQNIAADMKKVLNNWRDGGGKDEDILVY